MFPKALTLPQGADVPQGADTPQSADAPKGADAPQGVDALQGADAPHFEYFKKYFTSPFGDQRVNVHQSREQIVWLVKTWLFPVQTYHQSALNSFQGESTFSTRNQSLVDDRVKKGVKLLLLFSEVGHQIGFSSFICFILEEEKQEKCRFLFN
jgi:hypothetical protein